MILVEGGNLDSGRGIAAYATRIAQGLGSTDFGSKYKKICILCYTKNRKLKVELKKNNNGINFIFFPIYVNSIFWDQLIVPLLTFIYRPRDIFLLSSFYPLLGIIFKKFMRYHVTIHDVSFLHPSPEISGCFSFQQRIGRSYRRFVAKYSINGAFSIVTVSHFAAVDIRRRLGYEGPINVVPNMLPPTSFLISQASGKRIVIVSGNHPQKNLNRALHAICATLTVHHDWVADIVGLGLSEVHWINQIPSYDTVASRIVFHDRLDLDELNDIYSAASILLMPSLYESFAIPLIEAANFCCLVVSSSMGAAKEVLPESFFFNPYSVSDITQQLNEAILVANNKQFFMDITKRNQIFVQGLYNCKTSADRLLKIVS